MNGQAGASQSPVIISGMHRSGTTLLSRMLQSSGVFLGWRREVNEESRTFLEINKWLLLQAGYAWDTPPDDGAWSDPAARGLCTSYMRYALNSVWMSFYLGKPWWSNREQPPRFDFPWGWKDPRSTLTLPLWAEIYPDARLIHVRRHGVDVAQSLVKRHKRRIDRVVARFERKKRRYWLNLRRRRFETGCGSLEHALWLWERYQTLAERSRNQFRHSLDIRFEDLVDDGESTLARVIEFLELEPNRDQTQSALALPRAGRSLAYRNDEKSQQFAREHQATLQQYGYEP